MTIYDVDKDSNSEDRFDNKANTCEQRIGSLDYDECLISQRMAVAEEPSGFVKLNTSR